MFRRSIPRSFEAVAGPVEAAKRALLAAVPAPRREPEPLASALVRLDERLEEARSAMDAWPADESPRIRADCLAALDETIRRSAALRLRAPALDFESLVLVLGDVLAPLDAFADAEHALRRRG